MTGEILSELEPLRQEAARIKAALQAKILALPDNPAITRLGDSKCFTISSKDLSSNWSAEYHDFKLQYEALVDLIEQSDPMKIPFALASAIMHGEIRRRFAGRLVTKLRPEVIKYLEEIL